jgi:hypothetical protein
MCATQVLSLQRDIVRADGPGGSRESCRLNCGVYVVLCDVFEIVIGRYVISRHFLSWGFRGKMNAIPG